jgi:hypothetical protein
MADSEQGQEAAVMPLYERWSTGFSLSGTPVVGVQPSACQDASDFRFHDRLAETPKVPRYL